MYLAEGVLVVLEWVVDLVRAQAQSDDPALPVGDARAHGLRHLLRARVPRHVRGQSHLDSRPLPRLLGAVAVALEHLLPGHAAPDALRRREDALDVDGSVLRRLLGVVDDHLAEVVGRAKRRCDDQPGLDEVREVGEAVEVADALDRVRREGDAVPPRSQQERLRAHRALEVDVELDLRVDHRPQPNRQTSRILHDSGRAARYRCCGR